MSYPAQQFQQSYNPMMSADLANLAQQGYPAQQAQLQARQMQPPSAGQSSRGFQAPYPGYPMTPLQHAQQQVFAALPHGGQVPRVVPNAYKPDRRSNPKSYPARPPSSAHSRPDAPSKPDYTAPEPWTDAIDEIDHRELAMNRFRTRQEILSDIFGPERLKDIPADEADPWSEFGDAETLEGRVRELEEANAELERRLESGEIGFSGREGQAAAPE